MSASMRLLVLLAVIASGAEGAKKRLRRQGTLESNVDLRLRLENFNNVQYSAPITIGGQTLPVIYDTGSFEILVLSKLCTTCAHRHGVYDSAKSASFATSTPTITTEHLFGSGPVVSEKGFDEVKLGDIMSPYKVHRMPFWQVLRHEIAVWDEDAHFSGIVGLGHTARIPDGFAAPGERDMTMLASLGVGSFAICLERATSNSPGWLNFGPAVSALPVAGVASFASVDVVGRTHWGVQMFDFHIPGLMKPDPCVPSCGAIVDSGTSLIAAPPAAMPAIRQLSSMVSRDCSNLHQLPVLRFRVGGQQVELPPKAYVMKIKKKAHGNNHSVWNNVFTPEDAVEERCVPAFMTINKNSAHGPVWILGMPFLRYYYTIFDREHKKIHFSPATPTCQPAAAGGMLVNATHLEGAHSSANSSSTSSFRYFAPTDFEPTEIDPNALRMPYWASDSSSAMVD